MEKTKELIFLCEALLHKPIKLEILNLLNEYDHLDDKTKVFSEKYLSDQKYLGNYSQKFRKIS